MFTKCPYKEEYTNIVIYEDFNARCEHYDLSINYIMELIKYAKDN